MYLAYKELMHSKARYLLMILVIFLVSYLIYFLSGLAFGLAHNNRSAVDQWHAQSVVVSKFANKNLTASQLTQATLPKSLQTSDTRQPVSESMGVSEAHKVKTDVTVMGIHFNGFLAPTLIKGHRAKSAHQIVVDESLLTGKLRMGDSITLNGNETKYQIVGVTQNNRFSTLPVVFMPLHSYQQFKQSPGLVNAIVIKDKQHIKSSDKFQQLSTKTFIQNLPGYSAEVSTFALMIGALFVIIAFIIGIFMYIMTIEKTPLYGVMRAQGISSRQLVGQLMGQSFLLGVVGIGLGLIANLATTAVLPSSMPYYASGWLTTGFSAGLLVMVLLGAAVSIVRIIRIDPLDAIGGRA